MESPFKADSELSYCDTRLMLQCIRKFTFIWYFVFRANDNRKTGHFARVCQSRSNATSSSSAMLLSTVNIPGKHPIKVSLFIGKIKFNALIGTGSSLNFIDNSVTSSLGLKVLTSNTNVYLASDMTNVFKVDT
ncbi:hypothetical protein GJ496_005690 [Pomphorhynchus laevis]|nr:hypothetical protein GJ496_005690 [Pomphorhynchus laevis]